MPTIYNLCADPSDENLDALIDRLERIPEQQSLQEAKDWGLCSGYAALHLLVLSDAPSGIRCKMLKCLVDKMPGLACFPSKHWVNPGETPMEIAFYQRNIEFYEVLAAARPSDPIERALHESVLNIHHQEIKRQWVQDHPWESDNVRFLAQSCIDYEAWLSGFDFLLQKERHRQNDSIGRSCIWIYMAYFKIWVEGRTEPDISVMLDRLCSQQPNRAAYAIAHGHWDYFHSFSKQPDAFDRYVDTLDWLLKKPRLNQALIKSYVKNFSRFIGVMFFQDNVLILVERLNEMPNLLNCLFKSLTLSGVVLFIKVWLETHDQEKYEIKILIDRLFENIKKEHEGFNRNGSLRKYKDVLYVMQLNRKHKFFRSEFSLQELIEDLLLAQEGRYQYHTLKLYLEYFECHRSGYLSYIERFKGLSVESAEKISEHLMHPNFQKKLAAEIEANDVNLLRTFLNGLEGVTSRIDNYEQQASFDGSLVVVLKQYAFSILRPENLRPYKSLLGRALLLLSPYMNKEEVKEVLEVLGETAHPLQCKLLSKLAPKMEKEEFAEYFENELAALFVAASELSFWTRMATLSNLGAKIRLFSSNQENEAVRSELEYFIERTLKTEEEKLIYCMKNGLVYLTRFLIKKNPEIKLTIHWSGAFGRTASIEPMVWAVHMKNSVAIQTLYEACPFLFRVPAFINNAMNLIESEVSSDFKQIILGIIYLEDSKYLEEFAVALDSFWCAGFSDKNKSDVSDHINAYHKVKNLMSEASRSGFRSLCSKYILYLISHGDLQWARAMVWDEIELNHPESVGLLQELQQGDFPNYDDVNSAVQDLFEKEYYLLARFIAETSAEFIDLAPTFRAAQVNIMLVRQLLDKMGPYCPVADFNLDYFPDIISDGMQYSEFVFRLLRNYFEREDNFVHLCELLFNESPGYLVAFIVENVQKEKCEINTKIFMHMPFERWERAQLADIINAYDPDGKIRTQMNLLRHVNGNGRLTMAALYSCVLRSHPSDSSLYPESFVTAYQVQPDSDSDVDTMPGGDSGIEGSSDVGEDRNDEVVGTLGNNPHICFAFSDVGQGTQGGSELLLDYDADDAVLGAGVGHSEGALAPPANTDSGDDRDGAGCTQFR